VAFGDLVGTRVERFKRLDFVAGAFFLGVCELYLIDVRDLVALDMNVVVTMTEVVFVPHAIMGIV
jgi:hypothetical protein